MALLRDLLIPLLAAAERDLAGRRTDLPLDDIAGVAVLLGVSTELMRAEPSASRADVTADVASLRMAAQDCLDAVRRASRRGRANDGAARG